MIIVSVIEEAGELSAMKGLALNKNQDAACMPAVATKLAPLDRGHNKFLEHVELWMLVRAPRWWWQQADTYRLASKQSQSTMHTIFKRPLEQFDFNRPIPEELLRHLNSLIEKKDLEQLKNDLPEGFMQTREWKMSYKTLRNIVKQRESHRMYGWKEFIEQVRQQIKHPEWLV